VQTGTPWFSPEIKGELAALKYPFYYMDFETVNPAIPRFAGMRPHFEGGLFNLDLAGHTDPRTCRIQCLFCQIGAAVGSVGTPVCGRPLKSSKESRCRCRLLVRFRHSQITIHREAEDCNGQRTRK